ncbi:hypothetical protein [Croceimicrobium hydrocarbonivorans]|uniref:Uncharacterized protein n=1 Tax=Croceimicrobium hydrocarbonivorans TaxID=2761580 RepID=A0A7H0VBC1_9FLAO|nr:hypothetical protein [Croceimicrobium hydrocarbonivorans]QNR22973.1 hypothetical protein H4K34_11345 [Croceimicrobium hydrocarbonivorans]QNR23019.1 hypothetical protein H4K34_11575 [Croceimicrobium hydrocarbonivorans]
MKKHLVLVLAGLAFAPVVSLAEVIEDAEAPIFCEVDATESFTAIDLKIEAVDFYQVESLQVAAVLCEPVINVGPSGKDFAPVGSYKHRQPQPFRWGGAYFY